MGVKRSYELPVDLLMAPGFYFLFNLIIGIIFQGNLADEDAGTTELVASMVVAAVFAVFLVVAAIRLGLRYKLRRASGYF